MVSRSRRNRNNGQNGEGNTSPLPGGNLARQRRTRQDKDNTEAIKELTKQVKLMVDATKASQRPGTSSGAGAQVGPDMSSKGTAGGGMMRGAMGMMGGPMGMGMMGIQMAMMLPFMFGGGAGGGAAGGEADQSLGQLSTTADQLTSRLDEVVIEMGNLAKSTGQATGNIYAMSAAAMIQGSQTYLQDAASTAQRFQDVGGGMMMGQVDQSFSTGAAILGVNPMSAMTMTPDALQTALIEAMREGTKGTEAGSPEQRRMAQIANMIFGEAGGQSAFLTATGTEEEWKQYQQVAQRQRGMAGSQMFSDVEASAKAVQRIANELQVEQDRYELIRGFTDEPNARIKATVAKEVEVMKMQFGAGFGAGIGGFKRGLGEAFVEGFGINMSNDPAERFRGGAIEDTAKAFGYGGLSAEAQSAIDPLQFLLTELGEAFSLVVVPITLMLAVLTGGVTIIAMFVEGFGNLVKLLYESAHFLVSMIEVAGYAASGQMLKAKEAWQGAKDDWDPWTMGTTRKLAGVTGRLADAATNQLGGYESERLYESEASLEQQIQFQLEQQRSSGQAGMIRVEVEPGMRATYVNKGLEQSLEQGSNIGAPDNDQEQFIRKHGNTPRLPNFAGR